MQRTAYENIFRMIQNPAANYETLVAYIAEQTVGFPDARHAFIQSIASIGHFGRTKEEVASDVAEHSPRILMWIESSLTASHADRMIDVVNGMIARGFAVDIMASEDTIAAMTNNGQIDLKDYGFDHSVDYITLPSQTTYNRIKGDFKASPMLDGSPFEFMAHPEVRRQRLQKIDHALSKREYVYLVPELWPTGYGTFSDEMQYMANRAKMVNPDTLVYPLGRDIPYQDNTFDTPANQLHHIQTVANKLLYRGDKILEQFYPEGALAATGVEIISLGHFISPGIPEKDPSIADEDRVVFVSGGGGFVQDPSEENPDYQYFMGMIQSKPHTVYADREWVLNISPKCPPNLFAKIVEEAERVGGIRIQNNVPVEQHRHMISNAAAFVVISGYSGLISGIAAGVPTMAVPTMGYAAGALNDRVIRAQSYDAMRLDPQNPESPRPLTIIHMEDLANPQEIARKFNRSVLNHDPRVRELFNFVGEETTVDFFVSDYQSRHQVVAAQHDTHMVAGALDASQHAALEQGRDESAAR